MNNSWAEIKEEEEEEFPTYNTLYCSLQALCTLTLEKLCAFT